MVNEILAPYNKTQSYAIKARLMGTPERVATEILLSALWPAPDDASKIGPDCPFTVDNFLTGRNERLEEHFRRAPPLKGAVRLVKHLEKHDVPMCVATGSKRRNCESIHGVPTPPVTSCVTTLTRMPILRAVELKSGHNGELFDPFGTRVICGDDARLQRGKPTPDIFLLAAREGLGVPEIKEGVRMWGKEHDGESSGLEHEILVFEDAKVRSADLLTSSARWSGADAASPSHSQVCRRQKRRA